MYIDGTTLGVILTLITLISLLIGAVVKVHSLVIRVQNLEEEMEIFKKKEKEKHEEIVQNEKDDIKILSKLHDEEMNSMDKRIQYINDELEVLTYSLWACLKHLQKSDTESQLLTDAVNKIEQHLIQKHKEV